MQNYKAIASGMDRPLPSVNPETQKRAMFQMITHQIQEVINQYAPPENYRLKVRFDMKSSNLLITPKRCAFEVELCIFNPYLHIVVKKVSSTFQEAINQSIRSLEKNLKLVKKRSPLQKRKMLFASALILPLFIMFSTIQGCAHKRMEKEIDTKLQQEPQITSQESLQKEAYEAVEQDPNLTQDQKIKLLELQNNTRVKMAELKEKNIKLRSLLLKDLLAPEDTSDEVALLKRRIKKNQSEKISTLFSAIDQTNKILGKDTKIRGKMLQAFMDRRLTSDASEFDHSEAQRE